MYNKKHHSFLPAKAFGNFFDEFFNKSIGDFVGSDFILSSPSVNVIENKDHLSIELAAPGLEKSDFQLNLENNRLKITAAKENKEEATDGKYTRREFNYNSFERSFELPDSVNSEGITASYENGILIVTLPKKVEEETERNRSIEIQ